MVKVGERVMVLSLGVKGTIEHLDYPYLYHDHMYPVQVLLDERYYKSKRSNAYTYRTCLRDVLSLKSKKIRPYQAEIDEFLSWLDRY